MGKKIIWSSDALEHLEDIHFYILFESKSIDVADRIVDKIFDSTQILKTNSEIFELDDQKKLNNGTFRAYFIYDYKITYQDSVDAIYILRVRHTSRKPKNL